MEEITPAWTLQRLQESYPGVELLLFAHFGIGSRERSGFGGGETLQDLFRRHLVFDARRACARLTELAAEDRRHAVEPVELAEKRSLFTIVDARSEEEFRWCRLDGSLYLTAATVDRLRRDPAGPIVAVCRDGSQAPSASRVLRGQGLSAVHLEGGLERWSYQVDPAFPVLYPLRERPGYWYLLADGETLRYRRSQPLPRFGWRYLDREALLQTPTGRYLAERVAGLQAVVSTPRTFSLRGVSGDLAALIAHATEEVRDSPDWERAGEVADEAIERETLERVLREEAPAVLANHKGTVEVSDYSGRIVTLTLGGGCAGCASAAVTAQRELAAALYRAVPTLDGIRSA